MNYIVMQRDKTFFTAHLTADLGRTADVFV